MSNAMNPNSAPEPHDTNGVAWEKLCRELTAERDRLRGELAQLQEECRQYKKAIYAFMPSTATFTEQELADMRQNGVTFDVILGDMKSIKDG